MATDLSERLPDIGVRSDGSPIDQPLPYAHACEKCSASRRKPVWYFHGTEVPEWFALATHRGTLIPAWIS